MDNKYLPPSYTEYTPSTSVESNTPKSLPHIAKTRLRQVFFPVRLLLISILAVGFGMLLCRWLLPCFSVDMEMLSAHLSNLDSEASVSPPLQFLKLCLSCVPVYLILVVAGLTSFSRSLTTWVCAYRCVCEGFALAFLWQFARAGVIPHSLCLLYGGLTLVWVCVRMAVSLSSTHTSAHFFDPETKLQEGRRGISPLLARHTLICLTCATVLVICCGLYVVLMHRII